ncbi:MULTISPECIES: hypothetical protein [unclassified Microbacterium]|uniref:hypothetical protein n=1 Tax=unclassified Microbacterium TaxID=2609290 RepID=UPI000EAA641D|nr:MULTISPECIES: hypothetical protein [unclassified Microbacterium]MBT2483125.1 hypothetical protein [Microbacterium sp. ISL-108]RKN66183.1 hypothetical protein D7252_00230 [Microbacterium sp. CGR2]
MASRRPAVQELSQSPVVLPHVVITVTETGALDVTIDGTPLPPPAADTRWTRSTFGALMDAITKDRTVAVRIEVREVDGSVFTDIIRARRPSPPPTPDLGAEPATRRGRRTHAREAMELVEVSGEGFVPGEDVAVAVIVTHTDATGTGAVRSLLDVGHLDAVLRDGTGEVVLFGRVSGTVQVRRVP